MNQILIDFVRNFVIKDKQDRILQFYSKKKNWGKIKDELFHSGLLDEQKMVVIESNHQIDHKIYLKMKSLGAEDECFSIMDHLNEDPCNCVLKEKLSETVGLLDETILYCPKAKVAYVEGEHLKDRFILKH